MKPKQSHRYRICGTPVRTGCITCKIRRIKCGEEKPSCRRCTSTGRKCDGYTTPAQTPCPPQRSVSASQPLRPNEDSVEQSTLDFFATVTAPKLSGSFSSNFWERRVIQASLTEPSVRHGAIALGALHQDFVLRHENRGSNRDPSTEAFAFRQYTKAITHLHQLMSTTRTQQLDITLIACILFISFDCLLGNHSSAIIHLKAGLKILEDIKSRDYTNLSSFAQTSLAHEWEKEFSPLLLALGVQAASFVNPELQEDQETLWTDLKRAGIPIHPTVFSSLDEARHAFDTLAAEIMTDRSSIAEEKIPISIGPEDWRHTAALRTWEGALDISLPNIISRSVSASKVQNGATMLKVHGQYLSINIGRPDPANDEFDKLLGLCETLTRTRTAYPCGRSHLNFSIDMGLIGPLVFTALRAPQRSAQRRAYDLLFQAPGREGMWDIEDALRVAGEAVGVTTQQGSSGASASTIVCPQNEARSWAGISVSSRTRLPWLDGQKGAYLNPPSVIHGAPSTRSTPIEPGREEDPAINLYGV